jgi:uncharacterized membrane protein YfbV (UPF0208 family)
MWTLLVVLNILYQFGNWQVHTQHSIWSLYIYHNRLQKYLLSWRLNMVLVSVFVKIRVLFAVSFQDNSKWIISNVQSERFEKCCNPYFFQLCFRTHNLLQWRSQFTEHGTIPVSTSFSKAKLCALLAHLLMTSTVNMYIWSTSLVKLKLACHVHVQHSIWSLCIYHNRLQKYLLSWRLNMVLVSVFVRIRGLFAVSFQDNSKDLRFLLTFWLFVHNENTCSGISWIFNSECSSYPFLITSGLVLALLILICVTLTDAWKQKQEHSELNIYTTRNNVKI